MAAPYPSFPASPTIGQTYTDANGAVWTFGNIGWTKTLVSLTSDPSIWQDIDSALSYDSSGNVTIAGGLTAGGKVSIPLGTAPLPSLYFGTDTNTGIYSPGADQVGIATNGTSRLVVDASGNVNIDSGTFYVDAVNNRVGVGTTGPNYALHNNGTGSVITASQGTTDASFLTNIGGTQGLYVHSTTGISEITELRNLPLIFGTNATEHLRLDASGNLGLGVVPVSSQGRSIQFGTAGALESEAINTNDHRTNLTSNAISITPYANAYKYLIAGASATMYRQLSGVHQWFTAPTGTAGSAITFTQAMTLDASGNLGIGATSPQSALDVASGVYQSVRTYLSSITDTYHQFRGTPDGTGYEHARVFSGRDTSAHTYGSYLAFYTEGKASGTTDTSVERARIDSSGRLLVGASSTSDSAKFLMQGNAVDSNGGAIINLCNGKATLVDGEAAGIIRFSDNTHAEAATIMVARDGGTWSASSKPTRLVFSTTANGAASPTERMRITSTGNTHQFYYFSHFNLGWSSTSYKYTGLDQNGAYVVFNEGNTGVYLTSAGTSWTGTSDERLKTDLIPIEDGLNKVATLRAVTGRFLADEEGIRRSFLIAQDVQQVLPEAVDTTDPEKLGLSYTDVIPLLVSALKDAKVRIETLETKVAALESR